MSSKSARRTLNRLNNRLTFESLETRRLLATFVVSSTSDSGAGTFRQAIIDANSSVGADNIEFNIGGGGLQTITPLSALPTITGPTNIDATTKVVIPQVVSMAVA